MLLSGKDVQRRWQNFRTCFARELKKQKETHSGQSPDRRKKYIYFDQLLFLLPITENRPTVSDVRPVDEVPQNEEENSEQTIDNNNASNRRDDIQPNTSTFVRPSVSRPKKKSAPYEQQLLDILKKKKENVNVEEIDEDKHFMLSLVPPFKKFNDEEKYQAKMEFLRVIRNIQLSSSSRTNPGTNQQRQNVSGFADFYASRQSMPEIATHHPAPATSPYNYNTVSEGSQSEEVLYTQLRNVISQDRHDTTSPYSTDNSEDTESFFDLGRTQ